VTVDLYPTKLRFRDAHGFSLIEVMVVMVIITILATGVVFMFANPTAKVKTQAFELLGEINYARSVAVKENQNVSVHFYPAIDAPNRYTICFETTGTKGCNDEASDDILKNVVLRDNVQFYDFSDATALPADGPTKTPPYATQTAGISLTNKNGTTFSAAATPPGNLFVMQPDGTCDQDGAAIIYLHSQEDRRKIRGTPYAVVIASASTGQVKLSRWRPDMADDAGTPYDDRWSRK
jgi:prepilin-type N-terminal cleavage/methylation domain-containing protein